MSQPTRRTSGALVGLVLLALLVTGCEDDNGDDQVSMAPSGTASGASAADPPVETTVAFGSVTGRLPRAARHRLAGQVRRVVDRWIDAAYVQGDYPRRDFDRSWPGFTSGARAEARRDGGLMSNRDVGARIEGVEARRRTVRLDVLAVKRRPVGVTAHVRLRFRTTGPAARGVLVSGRLLLTPGKRGWQVFGYDIAKGDSR